MDLQPPIKPKGKRVLYERVARERVLQGAQTLYEAVSTTMGPKGRNVVIDSPMGPVVTHDGVTVARAVNLPHGDDQHIGEKVGADLVRQAASKMNDVAGDGTTTVTVLTYHILDEANKLIAAGHNAMELRRQLEAAAADVLERLDVLTEPIKETNKERLTQIAGISAGDGALGGMIAEVIAAIGKNGAVSVETAQSLETGYDLVEGYTFDRGYVSPYMVTDGAKMEAVYDKPAILLTDMKINVPQQILPTMEKLVQAGKKELLIVCEDVDSDVMGALIVNKLKGAFNTVVVKAPGFGDSRTEALLDLASLTGASVISSGGGVTLEEVTLEHLGGARRVIVSKEDTTIVQGRGNVSDRLEALDGQISHARSEHQKEQLQKRYAALDNKVAIIRVGGATETEIEEKKFRVDDAVAATKAALQEGIVAGGGVTLVNIAKAINSDNPGRQLLIHALEQPFRIILANAGVSADVWLAQVQATNGKGINVNDPSKLVDMKLAGVIDPTRVTKEAIQNAVSVAGTAMTMGALVVDEEDE